MAQFLKKRKAENNEKNGISNRRKKKYLASIRK
jgi:hypothetical protein